MSVADLSAVEGDAGIASIRVPVDLSAPSTVKIKVPFTVVALNDGATSAADAKLFKGTVTFGAGVTSKFVTVTSYGDTDIENDQHVQVVLGTPIGGDASIAKGVGLVTLIDDDADGIPPSTIQVSIGDVEITEADAGKHIAYFPVLLSSPATEVTKVGFQLDCSAAALLGDAKIAAKGTLTFLAGQRTKFIPLTITADTKPDEITEIFQNITSQLASVKVLDRRGDATINDDDGTLASNPGYRVPNFAEESLPSGSTFDAQAVGDREMVDQTPQGAPGTFPGANIISHQTAPELSRDGRYAAFFSAQDDLVPGDTNGLADAFVRDRGTGTTERVSLRYDGTQIQPSDAPAAAPQLPEPYRDVSISADGRYVAYATSAALDPTDSTAFTDMQSVSDVYLYDRVLHTTELVSVGTNGAALHGASVPTVSAHGRYVTFNLGYGSTSVYVRDRVAGTTTLVYDSALFGIHSLVMSANGRYVVTPSRGVGCFDQELVAIDLLDGSVERVDVTDDGEGASQTNGFANMVYAPSISGDGRYVAFKSNSWNFIPGMTGPNKTFSGAFDASTVYPYVRDLQLKSTTVLGSGTVQYYDTLSISDDGNLVARSTYSGGPATLYDVAAGTMEAAGFPYSNDHISSWVLPGSLSGDGRYLGFSSEYFISNSGGRVSADAWVQRVR